MISRFLLLAITSLMGLSLWAQMPGRSGGMPSGGGQGFDPSKFMIGRFYGKVVDENNQGLPYATVQLMGKKFDFATKTLKDTLWAGQLTEENGDFSLEKLPIIGEFTLTISFMGYAELKKQVDFGMKMPPMGGGQAPQGPPQGGGQRPTTGGAPGGFGGGGFGGGFDLNKYDKDLGNIKLAAEAAILNEVVVTAKATTTALSIDKKTYRVDKDLTTAGGNAQDALKNVPSLSVDLDGNVSMRNGAPQIFVDGKPTTLALNQISADAIESVEVITNPSAKFDAGGGATGIVNIVLKKEKKLGYNGNVRVGTDSRLGFNTGGDINARGEKINIFGSANININRGKGEGSTLRENLIGNPLSNITQTNANIMNGLFANGRAGIDYFIDNRNTITFGTNLVRGRFKPSDEITTATDLLYPTGTITDQYLRSSATKRNFRNFGVTTQFKHLYIKPGKELTADIGYNDMKFNGGSDISTKYEASNRSINEIQDGTGKGNILTLQTDFINPLKENLKLEMGAKATIRNNINNNTNQRQVDNGAWEAVKQLSDKFKFDDDIYAAYVQSGYTKGKWGYQAGLRAEGSFYRGALTDRDSSFSVIYPISLFPSLFVSRKLNETDQIQFAYTRRVNRPNFFQTMPFTDYSDSLNLRRGNPTLKPEFTNSVELSYQNIFTKGHNLLVSLYYKQASNLITSYQFEELNAAQTNKVIITGFANSNQAYAYGSEFTLKNTFGKWLDLTTNINVFNAHVDATNVETELNVNRWQSIIKENIQITLPKAWALQINGEYKSKASFTPSNNNDIWRGPMGGGSNSAQGYSKDFYYVDASLRKSVLKNQGNITLSISDIFATRRQGSYTYTNFFTQDTYRIMNPRLVRLNFSYRFGKMDTSLFKRKNTKINMDGNDMMGS